MDPSAFRLVIVVGVILSIALSRINKLVGGVVSLAVTTVILIMGLGAYGSSGWIEILGIRLSQGLFLIIVAVWYYFDVRQIQAGLKERAQAGRVKTILEERLRGGSPLRAAVREAAAGMPGIDAKVLAAVGPLLDDRDHRTLIDELSAGEGAKPGEGALACQRAVDFVNSLFLAATTMPLGDRVIDPEEAKPLVMPAVKATSRKFKLQVMKNDLIYAYNGRYVATPQELEAAWAETAGQVKIPLRLLRKDPNSGVWMHVELKVQGGPLDIAMAPNA